MKDPLACAWLKSRSRPSTGDGMGLRDRREERRAERRGASIFRMRQKLVSIGDDYWIEDENGQRLCKINGKALRVRETLIFEDPGGNELYKIQSKMLHIRDTMKI